MTHTATSQILAALKRGETLTQLEALHRFGTSRLASIIFNLRRAGHDIKTTQRGAERYAEYAMA